MHWRTYFLPFVLAASSAAAVDVPVRKSLSFGPNLPHAKYTTQPKSVSAFAHAGSSSHKDREAMQALATEYATSTLGHAEGSFKVRKDSYYDETTRVWHFYLRQVVHDGAIEVADGDINVNIRDGSVISYGDSVSLLWPIRGYGLWDRAIIGRFRPPFTVPLALVHCMIHFPRSEDHLAL